MKEIIRETIPQVLGPVIATIIISFSGYLASILFDNVWITLLIILVVLWFISLYVTYKRDKPKIFIHTSTRGGRKPPQGPYTFPKYRKWAKKLNIFIPIVITLGAFFYIFSNIVFSPSTIIIYIADFTGPDPLKYRVTETLYHEINLALEDYDNLVVKRMNQSFLESSEAHQVGKNQNAAMVIWGWYGVTDEIVSVSVNYELMKRFIKEYYFCDAGKGEVRKSDRSELESFSLQTNLSTEMTYIVLFSTAMAEYISGDWNKAIEYFDDTIALAPENQDAWPIANVYFYRGEANMELEKYDLAIEDFNKVIEFNPSDANAFMARAFAYDFGKHVNYNAEFIDNMTHYIELKPEDADGYAFRGDAYFEENDYTAAINDYNTALSLEPDMLCAIYGLAESYYYNGNYDNAYPLFEKLISENFNPGDAYFFQGIILYERELFTDAIKHFNTAISILKRDGYTMFPEILEYRGKSYANIGENEKAIQDFRELLKHSIDDDQYYRVQDELRKLGEEP